eukprot:1814807-Rhodomonas_salina.1
MSGTDLRHTLVPGREPEARQHAAHLPEHSGPKPRGTELGRMGVPGHMEGGRGTAVRGPYGPLGPELYS